MNKFFHFRKIRTKLIFWFLILGLVPLLLGISINYIQRLHSMRTESYVKLAAIRNLNAEQMEYWLANRSLEVKSISQDRKLAFELKEWIENPKKNSDQEFQSAFNILIHDIEESHLAFNDIRVLNVQETTVYEQPYGDTLLAGSVRYAAALEVSKLSVLLISEVFIENGVTSIIYTRPIYFLDDKEGNQLVGILQATVDVNSWLSSLSSKMSELGETGEMLWVTQTGLAINQLRYDSTAALRRVIKAKPATLARLGNEGIVLSKDYNHVQVLSAYTYLPITKWGFVVKQNLSEINEPLHYLLLDFMGLLIFSVILLVAMASVVAESISRPIIGVAQHANRIQAGNFEPNTVVANDEIGTLAQSFNSMGAHIQRQLQLQTALSSLSGALVGSLSMKLFVANLLKALHEISKAEMVGLFTFVDEKKELLSCYKGHPLVNDLKFNSLRHQVKELKWLNDSPKISKLKGDTIKGIFDSPPPQETHLQIITIPIVVQDETEAILILVTRFSFDEYLPEVFSNSMLTLNIGYSNALATDQLSIMASNLYDINQQLEKQTDELTLQSNQLKLSAEELQIRNIELEKQRKEIESVNRLKTEFLSNMSHEIRTPLHVILTLSGVIKTKLVNYIQNKEELEYLEVIERNGHILLNLISNIMDLSRIEAGKDKPVIRPLSMIELINNIMANISVLADEKELIFTFEILDEPPLIYSDEQKLFHVFQNIIGNAIKFTNSGYVKISLSTENQYVIVKIADSGIGIPTDQLKAIFNEFIQVDGSFSRNYEGTGLGLAIAYKIMKMLKGNIIVESRLGIGSTFVVQIPIKIFSKIEKNID